MSRLQVTVDDKTYDVQVNPHSTTPGHYTVEVDGQTLEVIAPFGEDRHHLEWALVDKQPYEIALDKNMAWIHTWSGRHTLEIHDLESSVRRVLNGDARVKAPIPGLITKIMVEEGAQIEADQPVIVLEAMKMENEIRATRSGVVTNLRASPGQTVGMGEVLLEIR